jgi:hypothetical protein
MVTQRKAKLDPGGALPLPKGHPPGSDRVSHLVVPGNRDEAIRLLQSWREGDEEDRREQEETWEFLRRALDEDRPSHRKLFP